MSDRGKIADARDGVVKAALNFAATEWNNGRETASDSMDLDFAQDQLDGALTQYVSAATGVNDAPTPSAQPERST